MMRFYKAIAALVAIAASCTAMASGGNSFGSINVVNQFDRKIRIGQSCRDLTGGMQMFINPNASMGWTVSNTAQTAVFIDVPNLYGCTKIMVDQKKTYKIFDDHGKINFSVK